MSRLYIELDGDVQLDRDLARHMAWILDNSPAFDHMADVLFTSETKQFQTEGKFASGGWAPLSPRYARWKAKHYPGRGILERTRRLKRSLTRRPFGIERIRANEMEIGTDVPYATYHQHGGTNLPQRRPLELREATRNQMVKILQRHIAGILGPR